MDDEATWEHISAPLARVLEKLVEEIGRQNNKISVLGQELASEELTPNAKREKLRAEVLGR